MARLLVIDDEDDIRSIAAVSLEAVGGHDVRQAASGAAGVEEARRDPPDALLVDVMMPGLDGPATVTELRRHPETAGLPVVMLTAKAGLGDRQALLDLGVAGVITKPFDPMELAGQLAQVLGWEAP